MTNSTDIAALLGSRICHDLVSPLGAIGNGVELMELSGTSAGPELALISESVDNAQARIRFFRIAFGVAGDGLAVGQAEVSAILAALWRGSRLRIDWQPAGDALRSEVKLAFLLLLCLETAMPWGGTIAVARTGTGWRLAAMADKLRLSPAWDALRGPEGDAGDISPAEVQFPLARAEVAALGRTLDAAIGPTAITLSF